MHCTHMYMYMYMTTLCLTVPQLDPTMFSYQEYLQLLADPSDAVYAPLALQQKKLLCHPSSQPFDYVVEAIVGTDITCVHNLFDNQVTFFTVRLKRSEHYRNYYGSNITYMYKLSDKINNNFDITCKLLHSQY